MTKIPSDSASSRDEAISRPWSPQLATVILELVAVEIGALAILTHLCQAAGVSYNLYAISGIGLAVVAAALVVLTRSRPNLSRDTSAAVTLLAASIASAVIPLVAHRPDIDDWYYVPNVVRALAHRGEALGFEIHFLYSADAPFVSLNWSTAQAYEYVLSLVSAATGIAYLDVYYTLAPVVVCFLIPVAAFALLTRFVDDTVAAAFGTVVIVGALLLMGETHNTPGNLAFTRAFQGKVFLLTVGAPAWAAFALDLLERPRRRGWIILALLSAGLAGTSATATVLLPAMALAIMAGHCLAYRGTLRAQLGRCVVLASTLAYTATFAAAIWSHSRAYLGATSLANAAYPGTFASSMAMHRGAVLTYPTLLLLSVIACAIGMRGARRVVLVVWVAVIAGVFLNPLTADFWIRAVTQNLYWRLVYALPFPLTIGIAAALAWKRLGAISPTVRGAAVAVLAVALVVPHVEPRSSSIFRYGQGESWGTIIGAPRHKMNPGLEDAAEAVFRLAPPGPMLAPGSVSGGIPMLSADHPQLRVREDGERVWLAMRGHPEEGDLRILASSYLDGEPGSFEDFAAVATRHRDALASIVLRRGVWRRDEVRVLTQSLGFHPVGEARGYVVLARKPAPPSPGGSPGLRDENETHPASEPR